MKVKEIFEQAATILGYEALSPNIENYPFYNNPQDVCNFALWEICEIKAENGETELDITYDVALTVILGTAMVLASLQGNHSMQNILAEIYSSRRSRSKSKIESILNVLPREE